MKSILPIAGLLAASIAAAPAASIVVDTVGMINTNNKTPVLEATGNSLNVTTFAADVGTAFASNTGGVWNFDGANFGVAVGETITLNYGTSLANSLVLTLGGTAGINQANTGTTEGTSGGPAGSMLGLDSNGTIRTFTLGSPLLTVGIFNTDRGSIDRLPTLTVNYLLGGSASTSGATADDYYFHGLSGTVSNPIVSFSLSTSTDAFVRYDDLGFVAVPEPSSALLLGLVGFGAVIRRRR